MVIRKKAVLFSVIITSLIFTSKVFSGDFYVGASIGLSDSDASLSAIGAGATGSIDDTDTGWKLYGGYRINENIAIEGGYVDLGTNSASATLGGTSITGSGDFTGLTLAGVVGTNVTQSVGIFAKAGLILWDMEASGSSGSTFLAVDDDGTELTFGVGVNMRINSNVKARIEWERFKTKPLGDDLDFNLLSGGIVIDF